MRPQKNIFQYEVSMFGGLRFQLTKYNDRKRKCQVIPYHLCTYTKDKLRQLNMFVFHSTSF